MEHAIFWSLMMLIYLKKYNTIKKKQSLLGASVVIGLQINKQKNKNIMSSYQNAV
jgi:cytosine/uracil/thiamine/allantoin permease